MMVTHQRIPQLVIDNTIGNANLLIIHENDKSFSPASHFPRGSVNHYQPCGDDPYSRERPSNSQPILTWMLGHVNISCDVIGARYSEYYFTDVSFLKKCRTWTFQSHSIILAFRKGHSIIQSFNHSIILSWLLSKKAILSFYHPNIQSFNHSIIQNIIWKTKKSLFYFENPKKISSFEKQKNNKRFWSTCLRVYVLSVRVCMLMCLCVVTCYVFTCFRYEFTCLRATCCMPISLSE